MALNQRKRNPRSGRHSTGPGNPDLTADQPQIPLPQKEGPNLGDTRPFIPQGIVVGDTALLELDEDQLTDTWGLVSPNYTPGEQGWRIRANGDAEFGDIDARGHIQGVPGTTLVTDGNGELGTNLLPNPSFEVDTTGWTAEANTTLTRQTTVGGVVGTWAARLRATGAGGTSIISDFITGIVEGAQYGGTAWAYAPGTVRTIRMQVDWYTIADAFISTSSGIGYTDGPSWDPNESGLNAAVTTFKAAAPATAAKAKVRLQTTASAAAEDHYFDGAYFSKSLNETAGTGWVRPSVGKLVKSLGNMKTGGSCLAFICQGGGGDILSTDYLPVTPGTQYIPEWSFMFAPGAGTPEFPSLTFHWFKDNAGTVSGAPTTAVIIADTGANLKLWFGGRRTVSQDRQSSEVLGAYGELLNGPTAYAQAPIDAHYCQVRWTFATAANNDTYLFDEVSLKRHSNITGSLVPVGRIAGIVTAQRDITDITSSATDGAAAVWGGTAQLFTLTRGRKYVAMLWFVGTARNPVNPLTEITAYCHIQISADNAANYTAIAASGLVSVGHLAASGTRYSPLVVHGVELIEDNVAGSVDAGSPTWDFRVRIAAFKTSGGAHTCEFVDGMLNVLILPA